jgi:predicted NUDIX family NTP pyrophosphohydrolase
MPKLSAGILLYRTSSGGVEVLLVHPGGPYWVKKDDGAWSLPKGEHDADEDPLAAAIREFREELGTDLPEGPPPVSLGELRQGSGKRVSAYAVEGDLDVAAIRSNTVTIEWPPRSGTMRAFPEVDRAGWFDLAAARFKLVAGQAAFLERLSDVLEVRASSQEGR